MKHYQIYLLVLFPVLLTGCGKVFFKKMILDNPDIIIESIKKHPGEYIKALSEAQQKYMKELRGNRAQEEEKKREAEYQNPKQPDMPDNRVYFGDKNAPITIVEYSDFQCPYCSEAAKTVKKVLAKYKGKVRVLYKHLPLGNHPQAMIAAKYYEAIGRQDSKKAMAFHDLVFKNFRDLSGGEKFLDSVAVKVKANLVQLKKDLSQVEDIIEADVKEARKFNFSGTPGFLVGGITVPGAVPLRYFETIIDRLLMNMEKKK